MSLQRIILIPGFGGSSRSYENYQHHFTQFEVVDFSTALTLEDHLQLIKKKMDEQNEKVVLIGVSWGGILALFAADRFGDQIDALVLGGAGRKLNMPKSLEGIMKFPFYGFAFLVGMFIASYPIYRIFDRRGYKQKYGGLGVLKRLGWKMTHKVFNETLLKTRFSGKLVHDTLFLNLTSDNLVDLQEIDSLIQSNEGSNLVESKVFDLTNQHHIHFTHELDNLLISQAFKFLNNRKKAQIKEIKNYVKNY